MKTLPLLITALTLCTYGTVALSEEPKAKAKPASKAETAPAEEAAEEPDATEEATELTDEQKALKQALENQASLKSFHVEVELKTTEGKATLSGELGAGSLSLLCTDVKGVKKRRIVVAGKFYLSADDGKTWQTDEDADKETTLLFNNIITAPMQLQAELLKEDSFTSKEEKIKGEALLHIEKPAKGEAPSAHFWLCKEPELNEDLYLRKVKITISGTDMDLPATITYTKLAEPVTIKAPKMK